jgi:hypothetical protein
MRPFCSPVVRIGYGESSDRGLHVKQKIRWGGNGGPGRPQAPATMAARTPNRLPETPKKSVYHEILAKKYKMLP